MDPLGILADDLTGACDCAAPFAARGARVVVCLLPGGPAAKPGPWDVLVVNTDSRNEAAVEARARVRRGALLLRQAGWPLAFKKIDSTLRGQVGPEIEELLDLGVARAWLAPAFPQQGRTVEAGRLLLRGESIPSDGTVSGGTARGASPGEEPMLDRQTPPPRERIADALGPGCGPLGQVDLATLEQGAAVLAGHVRLQRVLGCRVIVCDAAKPAHLRLLARMLREREIAEPRELFVGSAGLTRELAAVLLPEPRLEPPPSSAGDPAASAAAAPPAWAGSGPLLVFAGSRQATTQHQLAALARAPAAARCTLDPAQLDAEAEVHLAAAEHELRRAAANGARVLIIAVRQDADIAYPAEKEAPPERAPRILDALATLAERLVPGLSPRGLVLTGGDVALAVLRALHAGQLVVEGEVLPGIARARIGDGPLAGLPVVTKAGGFGDAQALLAAATALGAL